VLGGADDVDWAEVNDALSLAVPVDDVAASVASLSLEQPASSPMAAAATHTRLTSRGSGQNRWLPAAAIRSATPCRAESSQSCRAPYRAQRPIGSGDMRLRSPSVLQPNSAGGCRQGLDRGGASVGLKLEVTSAIISTVAAAAAVLAWLEAQEANDIASEANKQADIANAIASQANAESSEANDLSQESLDLAEQNEARLIERMPAKSISARCRRNSTSDTPFLRVVQSGWPSSIPAARRSRMFGFLTSRAEASQLREFSGVICTPSKPTSFQKTSTFLMLMECIGTDMRNSSRSA
jgi:hypothetical protein